MLSEGGKLGSVQLQLAAPGAGSSLGRPAQYLGPLSQAAELDPGKDTIGSSAGRHFAKFLFHEIGTEKYHIKGFTTWRLEFEIAAPMRGHNRG